MRSKGKPPLCRWGGAEELIKSHCPCMLTCHLLPYPAPTTSQNEAQDLSIASNLGQCMLMMCVHAARKRRDDFTMLVLAAKSFEILTELVFFGISSKVDHD